MHMFENLGLSSCLVLYLRIIPRSMKILISYKSGDLSLSYHYHYLAYRLYHPWKLPIVSITIRNSLPGNCFICKLISNSIIQESSWSTNARIWNSDLEELWRALCNLSQERKNEVNEIAFLLCRLILVTALPYFLWESLFSNLLLLRLVVIAL